MPLMKAAAYSCQTEEAPAASHQAAANQDQDVVDDAAEKLEPMLDDDHGATLLA